MMFTHMRLPHHKITNQDLIIAGKLHTTICGKISLLPILIRTW